MYSGACLFPENAIKEDKFDCIGSFPRLSWHLVVIAGLAASPMVQHSMSLLCYQHLLLNWLVHTISCHISLLKWRVRYQRNNLLNVWGTQVTVSRLLRIRILHRSICLLI